MSCRFIGDWRLAGGRALALGRATRVMGILNVTPDSFSDGGRWASPEAAIARGLEMLAEGADILDIGGESTRPGSEPVDEAEETARVVPVIRELARQGALISIDTRRAATARAALAAGAAAVNDVSGLRFDPELAGVAAEAGAGLILMHSRGTPRDMQAETRYDDVVRDVLAELDQAVARATDAGVPVAALMLDPGFGFAKTPEQSLTVLHRLEALLDRGRPVLVGMSRKSLLGHILDLPVGERQEASLAAAAVAAFKGAQMVRVHDVRATRRAVRVADAVRSGQLVPGGAA